MTETLTHASASDYLDGTGVLMMDWPDISVADQIFGRSGESLDHSHLAV